MRLRHLFPTASSRTTIEGDRAFFLRNQTGDMLSLFTTCQTRYAGWFIQEGSHFVKLLEQILVLDAKGNELEVVAITNTGDSILWEYSDGLTLLWKLMPGRSGLTLSLSRAASLRILLDIRQMYDYPEFGRSYTLTGSTVTYTDQNIAEPAYLHFRSKSELEPTGRWIKRSYPRDAARTSKPDQLFAYELGTITTNELSMGFSWNKEEATAISLAASRQKLSLPGLNINYSHDTLLTQTLTARASVQQALRWLESEEGILAGLPWFHQVWTRDELITALGLDHGQQREIIEEYIGHPLENGELPTFRDSGTTCADGVGWLCLVVEEHGLETLEPSTRLRLQHFLEHSYQELNRSRRATHGLIYSGPNATWMDTIGRDGYRIEIQTMFALQLSLLYRLTGKESYQQERVAFLGKVRQLFFRDGFLYDGLGDSSKRPNAFLAYILQPELLTQQGWLSCFETLLKALETSWGGLTSLDRRDPRFLPATTGEDNRSYHSGDSWFFVNNLAAVALHRLDARKFGKKVVEILRSSTDEILWEHMIGQPGEISSAEHLDSFGCGIQAFSGGSYLLLLKQLDGYSTQGEGVPFWEEK